MITDCERTVDKIMDRIPGKTTRPGLIYLCELVKDAIADVPGFIIELGTYWGRSAMVLAMGSVGDQHRRRIITIDNFSEGEDATKPEQGGQPEFWDVQRRFKCNGRVYLVYGETDVVPRCVRGQEIAMVFVDGDHHGIQVERDLLTWKPLVSKGGIMAFDDYGSKRWPAVQKIVDKHMGDWTLLGEPRGSVIAFRR